MVQWKWKHCCHTDACVHTAHEIIDWSNPCTSTSSFSLTQCTLAVWYTCNGLCIYETVHISREVRSPLKDVAGHDDPTTSLNALYWLLLRTHLLCQHTFTIMGHWKDYKHINVSIIARKYVKYIYSNIHVFMENNNKRSI